MRLNKPLILRCSLQYRKPTENIYKLAKRLRELKSRVKKDTCESSSKTASASNIVQGCSLRVRDFVYEKTDHYKMVIAKSPIWGGEVGEEIYEALDPDIYNAM